MIHKVKAVDFEYNLQYGPWQDRDGVPREIWDSIPTKQHNLPVTDGLGHTIWNALSYGKRINAAMKRLLIEGPRHYAGIPPYDDRWGRSRPAELPYDVTLHHRKLNCKDVSNWQDPNERGADLSDGGINTAVPIGGGYGGGNQFLWHQDFWYWGHGNGPLQNNEGSPNVSPFPDLATCFIAFTPCNRYNGGLELLRGSHRCRQPGAAAIEFTVKPWGQAVPTLAGMQFAFDQGCQPVYADLEPGDAIFCTSNRLAAHRSASSANTSHLWLVSLVSCWC